MANYRRTATGNWSTLAQWQDDGSGSYVASTVLPGAADVVYANNFTVTLDIDVVVLELRTTSALNVNAGGLFDFGAGNSVTANVFAGTTTCVRNNTANSKFVVGNITGGTTGFGVVNNTTGNTIITGNVFGGTGGSGAGASNGTGILTINGTATGNVAPGVDNATSGTIIVNGTAIGGVTAVVGARNQAQGTMRVTTAVASLAAAGIDGSATGITTINNTQDAVNGRQACTGLVRRTNTGAKTAIVVQENGSSITLVDPATGFPATADVRNGVSYASGSLTGSLVVPSANTVSLGVVYDNGTVGTALITAAAFLAEIAVSPDPLAERLRNVSTVATTAATVAAYDV